jgi:hypothetical protein
VSKLIAAFAILLFLYALTLATYSLYSKTSDSYLTHPGDILAGRSKAPNQYRLLVPLLWRLLQSTGLFSPDRSDRIIVFSSILFCYIASGALFYRSSRSMPLTMLSLVALLGSFSYGMLWKYRQEFFEVGFVSLFFLIIMRPTIWKYLLLSLITALGALNRETFVFCITGMAVHAVWRGRATSERKTLARDALAVLVMLIIYLAVFIGVRYHYGLSNYQGAFWRFGSNISNLQRYNHAQNALWLGAGMLLAYGASLALGNREYLPFIAGFGIPMLTAALFISSYNEHRIFYPLMALFIASILRFASRKWMLPSHG